MDPVRALRRRWSPSGGRTSLRSWLLAFQIAVAFVLLAGAGLLVRSLQHARFQDRGFDIDAVDVISFELPTSYPVARKDAFAGDVAAAFQSIGAGSRAALAARGPFDQEASMVFAHVAGTPAEKQRAEVLEVSTGYFDVLGLRFLSGRPPGSGDIGRHRIVANDALVRLFWPDGGGVGRTLIIGSGRDTPVQHEVIGIVRNVDLGRSLATPLVFEPMTVPSERAQTMPGDLRRPPRVLVRRPAPDVAAAIADAARRLEPRVHISTAPAAAGLSRALAEEWFVAWLAAGVGLLALVLASVGVFGVFNLAVRQQTRDIGVRIALGAGPRQVLRSVFESGLWPIVGGAVVGLAGAVLVGRLLRGNLYGLSPLDPVAYGTVIALLTLAAALALALPAWRTTRVDPAAALRAE